MCEASLDDLANDSSVISFSRIVSIVLVLWAFKDKIMLHCFREVKELHSKNLILGINRFTISTLNL